MTGTEEADPRRLVIRPITGGRTPKLEVQLSRAFDPRRALPRRKTFTAIVDTGSTFTGITGKVARALSLEPIGSISYETLQKGIQKGSSYKVSLFLPNKIIKPELTVVGLPDQYPDVVIGMNVISRLTLVIETIKGEPHCGLFIPTTELVQEFDVEIPEEIKRRRERIQRKKERRG